VVDYNCRPTKAEGEAAAETTRKGGLFPFKFQGKRRRLP